MGEKIRSLIDFKWGFKMIKPSNKSEYELSESEYANQMRMRDKNRLENFVDAVFAIAITLLVLEISVPVIQDSNAAIMGFLNGIWPKLIGYFLAFFILAILLNNHHRQLRNIEYVDQKIWWINLAFLAFVVLVPFSTTIISEYGDTLTAIIIFNLNLLIAGMLLYLNWARVVRNKYLLRKDITERTIKIIEYINTAVPITAIVVILLAFINPRISILGFLWIVFIYLTAKRFIK
jgi:uncharacterized membrane protein